MDNLVTARNYFFDAMKSIIPALFCITLHELAHGFIAYRLGDNTAKDRGRLSLNPLRHIDPIGFLFMLVFKFGWAKAVPVNMRNFKKPKRDMAITALAGPVMNFILAAIVMFIMGLLYVRLLAPGGNYERTRYVILEMLDRTAVLSLSLAVFNLLPFPPLDGSKIVFSLLSQDKYAILMRYERFGFLFLLLFVRSSIFDVTFRAMVEAVLMKFYSIAIYAINLVLRVLN
ncbi:MAG: site-2 protease family protein [Oscillospiraceae bacterium]|nr:site-2 protease family protein [Oscillospiraceae bacterium]